MNCSQKWSGVQFERQVNWVGNQLKTNIPVILLISILVIFVSMAGAEAKSKYTVTVKFAEYCCGYGEQGQKVTVTVVNFETDEISEKRHSSLKMFEA